MIVTLLTALEKCFPGRYKRSFKTGNFDLKYLMSLFLFKYKLMFCVSAFKISTYFYEAKGHVS